MRSSSISIYTRLEDKNMDERDIVLNSVLEELKNKKLIIVRINRVLVDVMSHNSKNSPIVFV